MGDADRNAILHSSARFGPDLPEDLVAGGLNRLREPRQLEPLIDLAATCSRLEAFHAALPPLPRAVPARLGHERPRLGQGFRARIGRKAVQVASALIGEKGEKVTTGVF